MDIDRILVFASRAGKLMLQSGGEIYRVEETVCRICKSFSYELSIHINTQVYFTPKTQACQGFLSNL